MKNEKKKAHTMFIIGVGAMAVYGAYSAVCSMKNMCCKKAKMITNVFKKKDKCESSDFCECSMDD